MEDNLVFPPEGICDVRERFFQPSFESLRAAFFALAVSGCFSGRDVSNSAVFPVLVLRQRTVMHVVAWRCLRLWCPREGYLVFVNHPDERTPASTKWLYSTFGRFAWYGRCRNNTKIDFFRQPANAVVRKTCYSISDKVFGPRVGSPLRERVDNKTKQNMRATCRKKCVLVSKAETTNLSRK